ncbi:SDR family NAD(P)-dependent oxidoreductase [Pollutimonas bauzanensis]|uniref:NAD(P)-dependent dehydrogenase, short-chain alcohol dehydrogenase family n=1 Tax=Pollutimonas bauzanensis TaxID=658167 RepID=A0A1M5TR53_9BURK|nr:SDR family NAD(P)-dependent oxidoreductase [Pollutimonas bauzanensis]SHH53204.1 NAD(P)-dependent dehydrogenase, short-chain alcohol dehydrogenase family [Pollutimonas bauzanensis]
MNTSQILSGRHALVTGGSRGIGFAVAQRLLGMGARVTLLGRGADALEQAVDQLAGGGEAAFASGDISRQDDVRGAFAQARACFGPVDILVNNAGQAASERFDRLEEAAWQQMIAVNLTGTFHCMQAALPDMLERRWGRIVNVASTAGLVGYAYVSAYCAAKHGVIGLTRALALETARKGITVNAVCPGYTETGIAREAVANITQKTGMSAAQAEAKLAERNPQGRLIQPGEVADAVAWLCLPGAAAISGQAIPVDGGEVMAG